MNEFFKLVAELGFPIAAALAGGYFVFCRRCARPDQPAFERPKRQCAMGAFTARDRAADAGHFGWRRGAGPNRRPNRNSPAV